MSPAPVAPPPGWRIYQEGGRWVAANPRGGELLAATEAEAVYLAWYVERENRKAER